MHGMSVRRLRYHLECIDAIECNIWIEFIRVEVRKLQLFCRSIMSICDLNLSVVTDGYMSSRCGVRSKRGDG
jgi:hypothetical protein